MLSIMRRASAVLVLVTTAACGGASGTTAQQSFPATPTATAPAAGLRHSVHSHCGVLSTTVNGVLWLAQPPLGDQNPPPGWDDNDTAGTFAVRQAGDAVFTGDTGVTAHFIRAAAGAPDPGLGCE